MRVDDQVLRLFLAGAAAGFGIAWLLIWRRWRGGFAVFGSTWAAVAGLIVFNAVVAGEPPLGNMYHVQVFLAACFLPLFGVMAWRGGLAWAGHYFAFASAIPLIGACFMDRDVVWRRMPALQSAWFVPHVTTYMISYSLATVAFVLLVVSLIRRKSLNEDDRSRYEVGQYEVLRLAFPLMTFGMLSGALWADAAWGGYWSWDSKETWSLITWMLYLVYFHCRKGGALRRLTGWAQGLAFAALLTTFLLVNLLPKLASALHSYASPNP
jgi:ABC-type transport system involved in cytochrome c biogenesis permease subunit